ncbi:MAG TPA: ATP synthase F0 subunit C [Syntrophorhabdaceae bacterium]|jgi:F-type H+-transporting ATPase subunit c|nr:ATP synthase F0 subunit C [Syntrophorhabdaceae bacterium]
MKKVVSILMLSGLILVLSCGFVLAAEEAAAKAPLDSNVKAMLAIGAGAAIGIAALGGALGQGKAAAAALEGIARNPGASGKIFAPMIIGLALIESLVIYALVIAFIFVGKL